MGRKAKSIPVGSVFGKFTVLSEPTMVGNSNRWEAICSCGKGTISATSTALRDKALSGKGCAICEPPKNFRHGGWNGNVKNGTYSTWTAMKQRCYYEKNRDYPRYGGRGVKVCRRWLDNYLNFLADMGERPDGMTLDRINSDGDYEPGNCKWSTALEQSQNRDYCVKVICNGIEYPSIAAFSRAFSLSRGVVKRKLSNGVSAEEIVRK